MIRFAKLQSAMQSAALLWLLLAWTAADGFAFEGNDDNVTRDYYVQLYQAQDYIPDFQTVFSSATDRRNYKKIREYLNVKEEMIRILQMTADEYYYGLSYSKQYATDYIRSLEDEINSRNPDEKILLRLNSVRPNFSYSGEYTVEYVHTVILPKIKERYREATEQDAANQEIYKQIQKNILAIQQDIFLAEQTIYASLSPEFRDQDFRIWISLTFSGLIAVILFAFFMIIYRRSDTSLYKQMLSSAGLQFITVFVLIVTITLFGILNVLGGSELAAILSGISGYILGKGGGEAINKMTGEESKSTAKAEYPPKRETGGSSESFGTVREYSQQESRQELPEEEKQKKTEEKDAEDEKFFPGNYEW